MSNTIKKVNISLNKNFNKVKNTLKDFTTFDGRVFHELDDGSTLWVEENDGKEIEYHEYADGTKTQKYINKNGNTVIETVDENGVLLNKRIIGKTVERYIIYENGEKQSDEYTKIYNIKDNIDLNTKIDINDNEWKAKGKYNKKNAEYHHYPDDSITIDYIEDGARHVYTYDKEGILKNKKVITDNKEVLTEYDSIGNIINTVEQTIKNAENKEENSNVNSTNNHEIFNKITENAFKGLEDVLQESKRKMGEIEKINKENYYNNPNYQEKLEYAINTYNQADGIISDVDFFDNGDHFSGIGCGVASIMYIYAMLNDDFDFDPVEFTNDAITQGYFTEFGSNSPRLLDEELGNAEDNIMKNKWGLEATKIESNADSIISALKDGKKIVFNVKANDGFYVTSAGHYIVLDHYNSDTNQIFVFDPAARPGFRDEKRMGYQDIDLLETDMFNIDNNPPLAIESNKGKESAE